MIGTDVSLAAKLLNDGELVAIPTETVYGLAANATDVDAVAKIYRAKNRPSFNPLILHFASLEDALPYVKSVSSAVKKLADHFWPGPLSILLPKSNLVPDLTTAGLPNVVVRVPSNPITLDLLSQLNFPLAAPSANISNTVSPTSAKRVEQSLGNNVKYILEGGQSAVGIESTIISCQDDKIVVLRQGGTSVEDLEKVSGLPIEAHNNKEISSPGQLKKHYATHKPLIVVEDIEAYALANSESKTMYLLYETKEHIGFRNSILLSANYSLSEIANNLFESMHKADESDAEQIVIERCKDAGIGRAINDRITRASSKE